MGSYQSVGVSVLIACELVFSRVMDGLTAICPSQLDDAFIYRLKKEALESAHCG